MLFKGCPGADLLRKPEISLKPCPVCGNELEVFSLDPEITCDRCGFTAQNTDHRHAYQRPETEMHDRLVIPQNDTAKQVHS